MGLANLIPFVFIAVVSANPIQKEPARTIYQDMINDPETCNSLKKFLDRTYYVSTNCNFTVSNVSKPAINELICFGIYDMALKICQATNKASDKFTVPDDLEKSINETMKDINVYKDIQNDGKYCEEIVTKMGYPYDQTAKYVKNLKKVFANTCVHECSSDFGNKIANPLCVILHKMVDIEFQMHPLSGEKPDLANINAPPVLEKDQEAKKTTKSKVEPKPIQKQVTKSKKVQLEEPIKVQGEKKLEKETTTTAVKVETVPKVPSPQVIEPVEAKPKAVPETMKNSEVFDNTGAGVEPENEGMGAYEESSKKDNEKKKDKVEEVIPKLEENEKKSDENRLGNEKPIGDDDYGGMKLGVDEYDDDDVHTKDENEKSDQKNMPRVEHTGEVEEDGSHAFLYFTMLSLGCIILYVMYLSKQKILATIVRLRRSRNRGRRRPSTANYRKLDCTLEEAVTSQCNANVTHVIY